MDNHRTMPELQAALAAVGTSPSDGGKLEMIVRRPDIDQREIVDTANLDLVEGLVGDNWRARSSSATDDGSANLDAQIAIINSRVIQALTRDRSRWALAGDQLFVDIDLSTDNLPPGQRLSIGSAVLEITDVPHTGCAKFTERFGHDAIRLVNSPQGRESRWRGIYARVVQAGTISTGDIVRKC